ncbi:MAG TPA: HipA family kinase [Candidatus Sulfotelmatobacter sp.]|nr:HipA family kinase [Candidatus Sulfotelmatobacter sp.]
MLRVYSLAKITKPVGQGASESFWLELMAVGKNTSKGHYIVANEYICARLGSFLGLPIPPFALLQQKGGSGLWFGSIDYCLTGQTLPPIDPAECVKEFPDISTGIILFDTWVANADRHEGNMNMDKSTGRPAQLNVFDHSHALFGSEDGKGIDRLNDLKDKFSIEGGKNEPKVVTPYLGAAAGQNRHCLLDALNTSDHFEKWHEKLDKLPDFFIQ